MELYFRCYSEASFIFSKLFFTLNFEADTFIGCETVGAYHRSVQKEQHRSSKLSY